MDRQFSLKLRETPLGQSAAKLVFDDEKVQRLLCSTQAIGARNRGYP